MVSMLTLLDTDTLSPLSRRRYYYAIVDCDSPATAAYLYKELDATELERTANLLDLSFVPDDVTFDEEFRSVDLMWYCYWGRSTRQTQNVDLLGYFS